MSRGGDYYEERGTSYYPQDAAVCGPNSIRAVPRQPAIKVSPHVFKKAAINLYCSTMRILP